MATKTTEDQYPKKVYHPHTSETFRTVKDKDQEKAWLDQGWLSTDPGIPRGGGKSTNPPKDQDKPAAQSSKSTSAKS